MAITTRSMLGWRLQQQHLTGPGGASVEDVVGRLVAVPSWSGDAKTAIRIRLPDGHANTVTTAVDEGRVFSTYAFRGSTHLMTPSTAAAHLAIRCAGRQWELASWRSYYGLEPEDWPRLRSVVRAALADGPLTQAELAAAVAADPLYSHLHDAFNDASHTILKPFGWQGDLCFSPSGTTTTFRAMSSIPGWHGLLELDEAGPVAIRAYLTAYGPAGLDRIHYWLGEGLSAGRRRIDRWISALEAELTTLRVDGRDLTCLTEHADEITSAPPSPTVVLIPGSDQWVMGPGTADTTVVPPQHRRYATRGANLVLVDGRLAGTWTRRDGDLQTTLLDRAPQTHEPDSRALEAAVTKVLRATS